MFCSGWRGINVWKGVWFAGYDCIKMVLKQLNILLRCYQLNLLPFGWVSHIQSGFQLNFKKGKEPWERGTQNNCQTGTLCAGTRHWEGLTPREKPICVQDIETNSWTRTAFLFGNDEGLRICRPNTMGLSVEARPFSPQTPFRVFERCLGDERRWAAQRLDLWPPNPLDIDSAHGFLSNPRFLPDTTSQLWQRPNPTF